MWFSLNLGFGFFHFFGHELEITKDERESERNEGLEISGRKNKKNGFTISDAFLWCCGFLRENDKSEKLEKRKKNKISKKENIFLKADVAIFWHLSTDVATLTTKI